jgi:hypothetical protein
MGNALIVNVDAYDGSRIVDLEGERSSHGAGEIQRSEDIAAFEEAVLDAILADEEPHHVFGLIQAFRSGAHSARNVDRLKDSVFQ